MGGVAIRKQRVKNTGETLREEYAWYVTGTDRGRGSVVRAHRAQGTIKHEASVPGKADCRAPRAVPKAME